MNLTLVKMAFAGWFRVKGGALAILSFLATMFVVEGAFWHRLAADSGSVGPYAGNSVVIFVFLSLIVSQITGCQGEPDQLAEKIESGSLDRFLVQPLSYPAQMTLVQSGQVLARLALLTPLLVLLLIYDPRLWRPEFFPVFLFSLLGAGLLNFAINHLLSTATFKLKESYALVMFKETLFWMLSGALIPLDVFPDPWKEILQSLPSAFIVYYPAQIIIGKADPVFVLTGQIFYLALLYAFSFWAWKKGIRHYQAYGS